MVDNGVVTGCACGVLLHSDMMLSLATLLETLNTLLNTWSANHIHSLWSDFHASFVGLWDRKLQCFSSSSLSPWKQTAALSVLSNKLSPGIQMFACTKLIKNFLWHVSHPFYYNVTFYLHTSLFFRDFFYHHVVTSGCAHRDYFLWKKSHVTHEMPLCDWSDALHVNVQD